MCTALLSIDENGRVLLVGVRDEMLARAWEPPARHWPELPGLIGGRDLQAGGTWLAVSPDDRRAACVLNGRGQQAPAPTRRSRGELPLRAATRQAARPFGTDRPRPVPPPGRRTRPGHHPVLGRPGPASNANWARACTWPSTAAWPATCSQPTRRGQPRHRQPSTPPATQSWPADPPTADQLRRERPGPRTRPHRLLPAQVHPGRPTQTRIQASRSRKPGASGSRCSTETACPPATSAP